MEGLVKLLRRMTSGDRMTSDDRMTSGDVWRRGTSATLKPRLQRPPTSFYVGVLPDLALALPLRSAVIEGLGTRHSLATCMWPL